MSVKCVCVYFEPVCACVVNNKALHWQRNEIFIHLLSKLKVSPNRPKTELQAVRPTDGQTDNQTGDRKSDWWKSYTCNVVCSIFSSG